VPPIGPSWTSFLVQDSPLVISTVFLCAVIHKEVHQQHPTSTDNQNQSDTASERVTAREIWSDRISGQFDIRWDALIRCGSRSDCAEEEVVEKGRTNQSIVQIWQSRIK
jgi:hypothetical protein